MNRGNRAYLGEFRLAVHAAGLEGVQQGGEGGGEDAQQRVARFRRERAGLRGDGEQLRDAVAEIHAFLRLLRRLRRLLRLFARRASMDGSIDFAGPDAADACCDRVSSF